MQNLSFKKKLVIVGTALVLLILIVNLTSKKNDPISDEGNSTTTFVGSSLGRHKNQQDPFEALELMNKAGVNLIHIAPRWDEIESSPGSINFEGVRFAPVSIINDRYPSLLREFVVVIKMIDTNVRTMPIDIAQKPFDDPEVLSRFEKIIDTLAENPISRKIDVLLIGNEIDSYLVSHPQEIDAAKIFYQAAGDRIHQKMPHIQVGTIFTRQGASRDLNTFNSFNTHSDVIVYTYYPFGGLGGNVVMRPVSDIKSDLETLATLAGDKPFGFTEIGYSSSEISQSSESEQKDFVNEIFKVLSPYAKTGQLEFMHYMMTFDPPPELTKNYAKAQGVDNASFNSMMNDLGLIDYDTGRKKPAWDAFKNGIESWKNL